MNSLQYKKRQLNYLSYLLKCKPYEIENILKNLDRYYGNRIETKLDKNNKPKTYKDGTVKKRTLNPSYNRLKLLQQNIKVNILGSIPFPDHIQGGVKRKNNITNAKRHQGNKYILTTDLQDFFPSVTHEMVYSLFLKLGYSNFMANYLTRLTTYKYRLPQGTPTSTHLANLVSLKVDDKILEICKQNDIIYTRFVDDLTFSSSKDFSLVIDDILSAILNNDFKISRRKTKYQGNQIVTGIKVFNNYIDATDTIKEKAKKESHTIDSFKPYTEYLSRIRSTNNNMV